MLDSMSDPAIENATMTGEVRARFDALLLTWIARLNSGAATYPAALVPRRPHVAALPQADTEPDAAAQDAYWKALTAVIPSEGLTLPEAPADLELEDLAGDGEYEYRARLMRDVLRALEQKGRTDFARLADDLGWAIGQLLPERWARESRETSKLTERARALRDRLRADTAALIRLHRENEPTHDCATCASYDAMLAALEHEPACDPFLLSPARTGAGRPSQTWPAELRRRLRDNGVPPRSVQARDLLQAVGLLPIPDDVLAVPA